VSHPRLTFLREFADIHNGFDVFFAGRPPVIAAEDLALSVRLHGSELERKVGALEAHRSQTAELIGAIGWERYAAWVAQEHFADHSPGRRQLPTRTVMPRSAAAWASRSSKVASSAGLVSSAVSNTQQSGIRRPVRARSSASCPAASPGSS